MKYKLKYKNTLIDSSFANQQVIEWVLNPEFRGSGKTDVDVTHEMSLIYDITEDAIEDGQWPRSALELIAEEANTILTSVTIGELWFTITKMQRSKDDKISFAAGKRIVIKVAEDLSVAVQHSGG